MHQALLLIFHCIYCFDAHLYTSKKTSMFFCPYNYFKRMSQSSQSDLSFFYPSHQLPLPEKGLLREIPADGSGAITRDVRASAKRDTGTGVFERVKRGQLRSWCEGCQQMCNKNMIPYVDMCLLICQNWDMMCYH